MSNMTNMLDYLEWRGDLDPAVVPLNEVDFALLSAIVYWPFERVAESNGAGQTLGEIAPTLEFIDRPNAISDWTERLKELAGRMQEFPRIANLRLDRFVNVIEDNVIDDYDKQFSAATYSFGNTGVVCFRGTDASIVGWREDFNMGYQRAVPSQLDALAYLEGSLQAYDQCYVCGHSKGGNLAMFAAAKASQPDRIVGVYNYDGPGLSDALLASEGWQAIAARVHTFVPESSIIGMVYGRGVQRTIVKSDSASVLQHNLFQWHVKGPAFVRGEERTNSSEYFAQSLNEFIDTTTEEERKCFVDALFRLVEVSGAKNSDDFISQCTHNLPGLLKAAEFTEDEQAIIQRFMEVFRKNLTQRRSGPVAALSGIASTIPAALVGLAEKVPSSLPFGGRKGDAAGGGDASTAVVLPAEGPSGVTQDAGSVHDRPASTAADAGEVIRTGQEHGERAQERAGKAQDADETAAGEGAKKGEEWLRRIRRPRGTGEN